MTARNPNGSGLDTNEADEIILRTTALTMEFRGFAAVQDVN